MKRNLFLGVCLAAFIAPTGVKAQYPQLTSEASQTYAKMKEELNNETHHSNVRRQGQHSIVDNLDRKARRMELSRRDCFTTP